MNAPTTNQPASCLIRLQDRTLKVFHDPHPKGRRAIHFPYVYGNSMMSRRQNPKSNFAVGRIPEQALADRSDLQLDWGDHIFRNRHSDALLAGNQELLQPWGGSDPKQGRFAAVELNNIRN